MNIIYYIYNVRIISQRREIFAHNVSLTPPLFIEVPVPRQESDRSYICVFLALHFITYEECPALYTSDIIIQFTYFFFSVLKDTNLLVKYNLTLTKL